MRVAASLLVIVLATGCGSPEKPAASAPPAAKRVALPSADQAREVIASSADFGDLQFTSVLVSLPLSRARMREDQRAIAEQLRHAGWIAYSGDRIILAKAKDDKRFVVRPNGYVDVGPLAKKELLSVDTVRAAPDGRADADITWRWVPTEVGGALIEPPLRDQLRATHRAHVTLIFDGTAWTVLRIEE
jgi:hypothetical protein